jgi:uncharacterized protein (TIGR03437 family)
VVSDASFSGPAVAPNSIATLFGNQLSPVGEQAATLPLPAVLAGISVSLRDASGRTFAAPLFYVSPRQINFLVPGGMSRGAATVTVNAGGGSRASGVLQIEDTVPGIFTQNADGKGAPAAYVLRVSPDGTVTQEEAYSCTAGPGSCLLAPVNLGAGQDQFYLVLFGTGIRNRRAVTEVSVTIGGVSVPVQYAGEQGQFAGLDQVNVVLPPELGGRGLVDLVVSVNSKAANTVQLDLR